MLASRLDSFLAHHNIPRNGVIYAGARIGENMTVFLGAGFERVLAIEPNPAAFEVLVRNPHDRVECLQVALSDRDGSCPYYRFAGVSTINSATPPNVPYWRDLLGQEFLDKAAAEAMMVECRTLDSLLNTRRKEFNVLYVNLQGGEEMAFRGAQETLSGFDCLLTEVNFEPRYVGSPLFVEFHNSLEARGFTLMALERFPAGQHGEAWYLNRRVVHARLDRERQRFLTAYNELASLGAEGTAVSSA